MDGSRWGSDRYQRATEPLKQKLRHDVAQMHYLQNQRFANSSFDPQGVPFLPVAHALTVRVGCASEGFQAMLMPACGTQKFLEFLEMNHDSAPVVLDSVLSLQPHEQVYVAETYNIQTFFPPRHRLGACGRDRLAPCLNPDLDLSALQRQYVSLCRVLASHCLDAVPLLVQGNPLCVLAVPLFLQKVHALFVACGVSALRRTGTPAPRSSLHTSSWMTCLQTKPCVGCDTWPKKAPFGMTQP